MIEYNHFLEINMLAETVMTDLRTKDFQNDFQLDLETGRLF